MSRNYPAEIEAQTIELERLTRLRNDAQEALEDIEDEITREVLREVDADTGKPRFSNDRARDLEIRKRCGVSGEWKEWRDKAAAAETARVAAAARLERLRGEFALYKIERRERIAAAEASA